MNARSSHPTTGNEDVSPNRLHIGANRGNASAQAPRLPRLGKDSDPTRIGVLLAPDEHFIRSRI